jgi:hypothetical protein
MVPYTRISPKFFMRGFGQNSWFVLIGAGYVTNYEPDRNRISGHL